jgi:hypothetical protein
MTPKELLDWVLAEATHPHGPKLITPGEIYADMARKLLAVVIDGEPITPDSGPTFVAELRPGGHYLISLDKHVTAEQADKMRTQLAAIFPGMTFGLGQGLKAVTREEAYPVSFNYPNGCPTCGSTGEPLSTNGSPSGMLCEDPWHADIRRACNCGLAVNTQREAYGPHHHTDCPRHRFAR